MKEKKKKTVQIALPEKHRTRCRILGRVSVTRARNTRTVHNVRTEPRGGDVHEKK